MPFNFDSTPSDGIFQTPRGSILPGGSSSDAARRRESSQQEGGPSNIFGARNSGSGRTPLFGQPSSQDGSPSNIFGPQSDMSSPLPSPSRPASSSTTTSRAGILTPRSDSGSLFSASASNLNLNASPGPASLSPSVDQPQVQQSIEQQDDAPATPVSFRNGRRTTCSSTSQTPSVHGRIPSVSLSPPEQGRGSGLNDMGSVDRELAQLRLSASTSASSSAATPRRSNISTNTETDMNMGAMAVALNNLDNDRSAPGLLTPSLGPRSPLNDDDALLTPSPSPHRRRSGGAAAEMHNVRDETPPNDRFNAAPFQNALSGARTLMGELANVLGSGALHHEPGSVVSGLYARAQGLSGFECPSRRTVGFVGDSATGKSSLLNSLLDCRNLTRTNNGGTACTCVTTEYHYRQGDDCVIKVERYSPDEIRKQVKDLLLSYRHFHLHGNDPDARVVEELLDEEDRRAPENRARLATDTFKAMFRSRMRDEAFLLANPEEEVLGTMYRWLEEAEELLTDEESITAALGECAGILSRLVSEAPSADGPAVWPFIKKIKLFVDAHILSRGLILVDLPGLRDVNSARRNITERYMLRCDEIFVVCMVGRAVTDSSVEGIFDLARQAGKSNIGIICTNSDRFEPEEESDNCRDIQMRRMIQDKIDACDRDREIIHSISEDLDAEDKPNAEEMTAEKRDTQRSLFWQKRRAERLLEQHEFDIKEYLMEVRAQRIGDELREKYGDRTSSRNLAVFFVSNTMYRDNRRKPRNRAVPLLELSGILAVRQHCMGMVSESQFALASTFLRDEVGALLRDVELWVRSGAESMTAERRRLVREALEVVERQMRSSLSWRTSELNTISRVFDQEFNDNLYIPGRRQVDAWGAAAARECWQWDGWLHPSYAAFCSKFGHHRTKTVGAHCWNEKIMKAMNASMEPSWSALSRSSETRMESITSIVARFMNWAVEYLEGELHHSRDSFEILAESLTSRERLLVTAIEMAWNDFDNNLRLLRREATKPTRTSFIGQGMEDAYQAANHESGGGAHARRKSHITNTASSPHLFLTILQNSRTEFHALTSTLERQVRATVAVHVESVVETLNIVRGENAAREADGDPAFRARVEGEVRRAREVMGGLITAGGI